MNNLMLHCGASKVEREQLALAHTPNPDGRWHPIAHTALLSQVEKSIAESGLIVSESAHAMTENAMRYFGLMTIRNADTTVSDYELLLGIRNSNDKSFPAALCVGSKIFVCDNMAFSAEIKVARRHTINIMRDLPELVNKCFGRLGELRHSQEKRFTAYKSHELTGYDVQNILIEAVDSKAANKTDAVDILREWKTPRHPEFYKHGDSVWRLFNAFTEIGKPSDRRASIGVLNDLPAKTITLQGILDRHCGLSLMTAETN